MNTKAFLTATVALASLTGAFADRLPPGTEVNLVFRQNVTSKWAKPGEQINLAVKHDVRAPDGRIVLAAGTPVVGIIDKVKGRAHFGVNAQIRIDLEPIHGIRLEPRDKGAIIGGTRTDEAAAASGGAALVFGPLGLIGGYFVVGHNVNIHPGDTLRTVVVSP